MSLWQEKHRNYTNITVQFDKEGSARKEEKLARVSFYFLDPHIVQKTVKFACLVQLINNSSAWRNRVMPWSPMLCDHNTLLTEHDTLHTECGT